MADLSSYSTEELMRMRAGAAPSADLSQMSTEDLMRLKGRVTREPDAIEKSALEAMKPTRLERLGRGFADITQGARQLYLNAKDAVTSPSMSDLVLGNRESDRYTREKTDEANLYEKGRGPDAGIDWMRLGGNVAATLPAALIPGGQAASLLTRAGAGAAQGAVSSGVMFTPEGQSKIEQTLIGAGFGAAVPAAIEGVRRAWGSLGQKVAGGLPVNPSQVQGTLTLELKQQGIDFNKLTQNVQQSLIDDVTNALKTGGKVDASALARKADIESVGAKGTQAAVTRAPKDWQTQANMRGITGVGEPIAERQASDAQAMIDYLSRLRTRGGGSATTPAEAGETAINALRNQDENLRQGVNAAYDVARDHLGRAAPMDSAGFSRAANLALDEQMLGAYLPSEVRSILNDVTAGKIPFNVNTAVQIDSTLSAAQRSAGQGSPQALAIGKVRDALNNAAIADNVGQDAKQAFDTARAAARSRFQLHDEVPAMGAAIDDATPDRFVEQFFTRKQVDSGTLNRTIRQLRTTPEGTQAINDIKGTIFDSLLMKATGATNVDDVTGRAFSGRNFAKALDAIPPEKLNALFTTSEMDALRTLQRASKYLTEEVPFSDVNYSKTSQALANLLMKIGQTPLLGGIVSPIIGAGKIGADWVKSAADRKAVADLLLTSAGQRGAALQLPPPGGIAQALPAVAAGAGQRFDNESK